MQHCKNCEKAFEGKYCPNCGQKAKTKRVTTKQVWEDLRTSIFHYDSGFFYTVWELMKRPGHTVREYLEGKRVAHIKPIKFLIWATALNFLVFHLLGLDTEMIGQFAKKQSNSEVSTHIMEYVFQHPTIITALMVPCITLFSWWLYRKNGGYNFAENFVLNSYLMGAASMFGLISNPILKLMGNSEAVFGLKTAFGFLVYIFLFGWGYVQFFQPRSKWLGWLKSLLVVVLGYVFMILVVALLTIVFVLVMQAISAETLQEWIGKPSDANISK